MTVRIVLRLAALLVCFACAACARGSAVQPVPDDGDGPLRHGAYTVEVQRDDSGGAQTAVIRQGGRTVWRGTGFRFGYGDAPGADVEGAAARPPAVRDLTGDGVPELLLHDWSGGAHCCFTFYVFTLGPRLAVLDTLPLADSDLARFEDLDGDGRYELRTNDWTFAYWNTSFAGSPAPEVVLEPGEDGFRLAERFARKPPLPADTVRARLVRVRDEWSGERRFPPVLLWGTMIEMIYGGNAAQVPGFVDCAWRGDATGKEVFLRYFHDQLMQSPYYAELGTLNGGDLHGALGNEGGGCDVAA